MKQGWEVKAIGEICTLKSGNSNNSLKGELPYVKVSDMSIIGNEVLINTSSHYVDYQNNIKYIFPKGTVIFPKRGGAILTNKKRLTVREICCDLNIMGVIPSVEIHPFYLFYYFQNINLAELCDGASIPQINNSDIAPLVINYPSLSEQERIVGILDRAFAKIEAMRANAEQNLQNAKALFQASLKQELTPKQGWRKSKIKDIGITQTGTTPKTAQKENYGDFIPFIKPADVSFDGLGGLDYNNEALSQVGLSNGRKIEKNSILMVCIGATIGKVGYSTIDISCNQQINSLTPMPYFDPKFFYYAMKNRDFLNEVIKEGKGAQATLPIINKSKWENLYVNYPNRKDEQQSIVEKLDALSERCRAMEDNYRQTLAACNDLKQALLKKAFNGEL